jgi:hypothetical protein
MDDILISVWGPQMRKALLLYFRDYGVPNPDPADLACLTAIGVTQIERNNLGFKTTSFLGMASLLVFAFLDPNHFRHGEIVAAVQACKGQLGAGVTALAAASGTNRVVGSLADTVELREAAKVTLLGNRAKTLAKMMATKATPSRTKARKKRGPK